MVDPGIGRTIHTSVFVFSLKSWVIANKTLCRDDFCNTGNTCTPSSNYFSMWQTHTSSAVLQGLFTLKVRVRSDLTKKHWTRQNPSPKPSLLLPPTLCYDSLLFSSVFFNSQLAFLKASVRHFLYFCVCSWMAKDQQILFYYQCA